MPAWICAFISSVNHVRILRTVKLGAFLLVLFPLGRLFWLALSDGLGANPVEFVIRSLGTWALVLLLLTLSMTPLRILSGNSWPLQFRRMLGLSAFFYACLHLLAYVGLDQWFDWTSIAGDIAKHPYVLAGFAGFLLLVPLAATSSQSMVRRLGHRWKTLHRLVYLVGMLGVLHYWWLVKKDVREPLIYAAVLGLLFAIRIVHYWRTNGVRSPKPLRSGAW